MAAVLGVKKKIPAERVPCISCKEPIDPVEKFCRNCGESQIGRAKSPMKKIVTWAAALSAVLGVILSLRQVSGPLLDEFRDYAEVKEKIRLAKMQRDDENYMGALETYSQILQHHPRNRSAKEGQLQATMARIRNYSVTGRDDRVTSSAADAELSKLMPTLELASADAKGEELADITAHLGWSHRLKFYIAETSREDDCEPYLRRALQIDPANVYANALLGNLLVIHNEGALAEATALFRKAINSGKERKWVRTYQLSALEHASGDNVAVELLKVANEMRKNGEAIGEYHKSGVRAVYDFRMRNKTRLAQVLAAIPFDDGWATYVWVNQGVDTQDPQKKELDGDFIRANIDELKGRKDEARSLYEKVARVPRTDLVVCEEAEKRLKDFRGN